MIHRLPFHYSVLLGFLAVLVGCQSLSPEERALKRGGDLKQRVIEKAYRSLAQARRVSLPDAELGEPNWALTVIVRYDDPEKARRRLADLMMDTEPATQVYALAGYALLQSNPKDFKPSKVKDSSQEREVYFHWSICLGGKMSVRQVLQQLEAVGWDSLLLDRLRPLYYTE